MTQTALAKLLSIEPRAIQRRTKSTNRETRIIFKAILEIPEVLSIPVIEAMIAKDKEDFDR